MIIDILPWIFLVLSIGSFIQKTVFYFILKNRDWRIVKAKVALLDSHAEKMKLMEEYKLKWGLDNITLDDIDFNYKRRKMEERNLEIMNEKLKKISKKAKIQI